MGGRSLNAEGLGGALSIGRRAMTAASPSPPPPGGRGGWGDPCRAAGHPGPAREAVPHSDEFRAVFLNPPDIGGRYSALSYVGLVPGALLDLDLEAPLAAGRARAGAP